MSSAPIDVLVPVFNDQAGIDRAIKSVGEQTLKPNQLVIVDDASNDAITIPKVAYDIPILLKRLDNNQGPSAARNCAIDMAESEYLAFLDSDDEWYPQKLEKQFAHLKRDESKTDKPLACVTGFHIEGGYGLGSKKGGKGVVPMEASNFEAFTGGCWHCPGSTLLIKRQTILDSDGYDKSLKRLEDYDFFLRFADAGGSLVVCPDILSKIYVKRDDRRELPYEAFGQILDRYTGKDKPYSNTAQNKIRAYLFLELAAQSYRKGNLLAAFRFISMSFYNRPRISPYIDDFWKSPS